MEKKQVKHLAITFNGKMFRILVETSDETGVDISKLFPNFNLAAICDFIYNLTDEKIIKCRYPEAGICDETVYVLFSYLPLITMSDFKKEVSEWIKKARSIQE